MDVDQLKELFGTVVDSTIKENILREIVNQQMDPDELSTKSLTDLQAIYQDVDSIVGEVGGSEYGQKLRNHVLNLSTADFAASTIQSESMVNLDERSIHGILNKVSVSFESAADSGKWAVSINDLELRSKAVKEVIHVWSSKEPTGLADWASNLPAGGNRDLVVNEIVTVRLVPGEDTEEANLWIDLIADPAMKDQLRSRYNQAQVEAN